MFSINTNPEGFQKKMDVLLGKVQKAVFSSLSDEIKPLIVDKITDSQYFNNNAKYKAGDGDGDGKYDLHDSGQFMETVMNPTYNTVSLSDGNYTLGVGNIEELDKLVSPRKGRNPDNRYWRLAVFGRARIPGWRFQVKGYKQDGKPVGYAIERAGDYIESSEPTGMFDRGNGFAEAEKEFSSIISKNMRKYLK